MDHVTAPVARTELGPARVVGVTGSRKGITRSQVETFETILLTTQATSLVHGDCIGADLKAARMAAVRGITTVAFPPTDEKLRARHPSAEIRPQAPYLERNRAIVHECDLLVGFPSTNEEARYGGTWYTVRYAAGKVPVLVIWPDGRSETR